jgi:hypothetical protein
MIGDKTLNKLNEIFSKKVLKYIGPILGGTTPDSEIDFKIKFLGYRKMISVGEYYDYLRVEVTIVGVYDTLGNFLFNPEGIELPVSRDFWEKERWYFISHLGNFISDKLQPFSGDGELIRVVIEEVKVDLYNKEPIKEEKMSKIAVRSLVKDLTKILKNKEEGTFYLPDEDGGEYSFGNLPFTFSCEFEVIFDDTLKGFLVNGDYSYEDDVVELVVKVNPDNIMGQMYDIIGELNEIVAHELEHGRQYFNGEIGDEKEPETNFDYYSQIKEIKAQRVGFKRLSKLRRKPVDEIAKNWFKTHKDIHGLNEEETRKVLSLILN